MPRPERLNAEYFTHLADFRNDRRVKAVRAQLGVAGYGILCMMYEALTDASHTALATDEIEMELLAGDFGVSVTEINSLIQLAEKIGIFARNNAAQLICPDLTKALEPVFDKRNRAKKAASDAKLSKESGRTVVSVTETTQSKVKESKVKESKESLTTTAAGAANPQVLSEQEKKFNGWQKWANENAPRVLKMKRPISASQLESLVAELGNPLVKELAEAMDNHAPLIQKNMDANKTMRAWAKNRIEKPLARASQYGPAPTPKATKVSAASANNSPVI